MIHKHLTLDHDRPIATITLNRPDRGNALSVVLMEEIVSAARSFKEDTNTRVVIIRGKGKHFAAVKSTNSHAYGWGSVCTGYDE